MSSPLPTPQTTPRPAMHMPAPTPLPMVHLPFLPFHDNPTNWDNVGIAFWSGLPYSAIVDLDVGLVIYAIQRQNESRRLRQEAESNVLRLRVRCNRWIGFGMRDRRHAWPYDGTPEMIEIIQEESLLQLRQILIPKERKIYRAIEELQWSYQTYVSSIQAMTGTLRRVIRPEIGRQDDVAIEPRSFWIPYGDAVELYCVRRALGETQSLAVTRVAGRRARMGATPQELEDLWCRVIAAVGNDWSYDGDRRLGDRVKELDDAINALNIALVNVTLSSASVGIIGGWPEFLGSRTSEQPPSSIS